MVQAPACEKKLWLERILQQRLKLQPSRHHLGLLVAYWLDFVEDCSLAVDVWLSFGRSEWLLNSVDLKSRLGAPSWTTLVCFWISSLAPFEFAVHQVQIGSSLQLAEGKYML